ncbi:unnamed protein product [Citrullus colocynthis]|uniref:Uncharacterized protein n=1 Tax=Citrullus colocynthis TaxID=252529 RepID=A0ABP0Z844_9ROSI
MKGSLKAAAIRAISMQAVSLAIKTGSNFSCRTFASTLETSASNLKFFLPASASVQYHNELRYIIFFKKFLHCLFVWYRMVSSLIRIQVCSKSSRPCKLTFFFTLFR